MESRRFFFFVAHLGKLYCLHMMISEILETLGFFVSKSLVVLLYVRFCVFCV